MSVLKNHKYKLLTLLLLGLFIWTTLPLYQFFAHQGKLPLPPWGFVELPDEQAPSAQHLLDVRYRDAAEQALTRLEVHRQGIKAPGISAAVAIDGRLVWTGTSGWADIASRRPVTPETRFRIGSTSKPVTATALAQLVQAGFLDLDRKIDHYLQPLPNPQWSQLTARQLASHMAGLPEYKENRDWWGLYHTMALKRRYESVYGSLEVFDGTDLLYPPGEQFHYSSFDTVLLSAVLEAAAGEDFSHLMDNKVFEPLAMPASGPEPKTPSADMATFYWSDGERLRPWRKVDLSHRLAGGGFLSTPSDLVKLGSAWLDDKYISPQVRAQFWQPQRLNDRKVNRQNYALGWRLAGGDDYIALNANHGGVSRGSQCWLMVIPEYRMSVAVAINSRTEEFWDFGQISVVLAKLFHQFSPVGQDPSRTQGDNWGKALSIANHPKPSKDL